MIVQLAQSSGISEDTLHAELMAFLVSGRAASIHGADYMIDGDTMPTI